jgi:dipeptidyl aminopeptidase/acylaminoacyl peptidase
MWAIADGQERPEVTVRDYARAWKFMDRKLDRLVTNRISGSGWLKDGRFWYNKTTTDGHTFILVNPRKKSKRAAFDHHRLAEALSAIAKKKYNPLNLPFKRINFTPPGDTVIFRAGGKEYRCNLKTYECNPADKKAAPGSLRPNFRRSPDGRYEAFIKDYNLWVTEVATGKKIQLTFDGIKDFGYATNNAGWAKSKTPVLLWSPDSNKIATFQQDARKVGEMYLVSTNVGHPKLEAWKYDLPGDKHIFQLHRVIVQINPLKVVRLKMAADAQRSTITDHVAGWGGKLLDVQWNEPGSKLAFVSTSRDHKTVTLRIADARTGAVRDVFTETTRTWFESGFREPNWRVFFESNEVLWFSQRHNWGHLYMYNLKTAKLKWRVTKGPLNVKRIVKIDRGKRLLYFIGSCRQPGNPYYDYFYKISFRGRGMKCLNPERAHHTVALSPDNNYFIDTYSTMNTPPVAVLRTMTGKKRLVLEKADISALQKRQWQPPRVIVAKGRDGQTDLYGLMYTPSRLDTAKSYPIINYIYPGPQSGSVRGFSFRAASSQQALAELGFVVVAINGMGTPGRSKAFQDTWYGNMGDNTLPDQIAVMKELARRHAWIDINRVGIYGHSGGGFASADAILRYPDFFKVAVSSSGNHDNRNYEAPWGEKYQGLFKKNQDGSTNYDNQATQLLARNLKGKLLITHGMMDNNVPPYATLLVVQELIKANKDFDLLLFPGSRHGYKYRDYMNRRRWDYFVQNLLGVTPPKEFDFKKKQ